MRAAADKDTHCLRHTLRRQLLRYDYYDVTRC